ncbi:hypothetical protein FRC12_004565 [Ceratobasidium sp. 428]|nr:hypothetical protein FRC12_004565 [Ceratobasidium sp. 428]
MTRKCIFRLGFPHERSATAATTGLRAAVNGYIELGTGGVTDLWPVSFSLHPPITLANNAYAALHDQPGAAQF